MKEEQLKDTVVFCQSWHETMKASLTPEQYVEVMESIMTYYSNGCEMRKTDDPLVDAIAMMCRHTLDENLKRYIHGKKGGRPKKDGVATA